MKESGGFITVSAEGWVYDPSKSKLYMEFLLAKELEGFQPILAPESAFGRALEQWDLSDERHLQQLLDMLLAWCDHLPHLPVSIMSAQVSRQR